MGLFKKNTGGIIMKNIFLLITLLILTSGFLFAQSEAPQRKLLVNDANFPNGNFWSLDWGIGISNILIAGTSFHFVIDPKLWISPPLMVGAKASINYSTDEILTFEGIVYLRWNFLRFRSDNIFNVFAQFGLGMLTAYRNNTYSEDSGVPAQRNTRGSILADLALGITIPLTQRWHIEPQARLGIIPYPFENFKTFPHIWGVSVTAGYKFPLPQKTTSTSRTEYVEVIRSMPPNEIIKVIRITAIEFILFGPDIGRYNVGIDRDAQQLNELVLNYTAETLIKNPDFRVRLEGHANPYTVNVSEAEDLMALSNMRANAIADLLRERGVSDEQIVIVGFGGTRAATSEWDIRNRNRRVELMIIQVDLN